MYDPMEHESFVVQDEMKQPKKKNPMGFKIVALCLACTLLGGGAGLGAALAVRGGGQPAVSTEPDTIFESTAPATDAVAVTTLPEEGSALTPAQVYARNVGSCVGITVSTTTTNVFGYTTKYAATGSGFVLTQNGYIATNYHVIEQAAKSSNVSITVSFQNGKSYKAKYVGGESDNDVAVLKIEAEGLTPAVLGDSDRLVVGESVYAIGNPLGELTYSLTDGLVSALDRVITTGSGSDATSMNMLQTNCAINPGNSGGPLFNRYGQVIGITTAKMSSGGTSDSASVEGLGFAIPINDVKSILTDLIQKGYVTGRPSLGIRVSSVSQEDADRYGLRVGAYVEDVQAGSAAEKAGLEAGDIIIAIDEREVASSAELIAAKGQYRAGESATLTVLRGGKELKIEVTFDEEKEKEKEKAPDETREEKPAEQETPRQDDGNDRGGQGGYEFYWPFGDFPFSEFFR